MGIEKIARDFISDTLMSDPDIVGALDDRIYSGLAPEAPMTGSIIYPFLVFGEGTFTREANGCGGLLRKMEIEVLLVQDTPNSLTAASVLYDRVIAALTPRARARETIPNYVFHQIEGGELSVDNDYLVRGRLSVEIAINE
mgnify:CR=1 FL=1